MTDDNLTLLPSFFVNIKHLIKCAASLLNHCICFKKMNNNSDNWAASQPSQVIDRLSFLLHLHHLSSLLVLFRATFDLRSRHNLQSCLAFAFCPRPLITHLHHSIHLCLSSHSCPSFSLRSTEQRAHGGWPIWSRHAVPPPALLPPQTPSHCPAGRQRQVNERTLLVM